MGIGSKLGRELIGINLNGICRKVSDVGSCVDREVKRLPLSSMNISAIIRNSCFSA